MDKNIEKTDGLSEENQIADIQEGDIKTEEKILEGDGAGSSSSLEEGSDDKNIKEVEGLTYTEDISYSTDQQKQDDDEWPINRSNVDIVRERQTTFIVFIDQKLRLRWLAAFSPSSLSAESQNVLARARFFAAATPTYFKDEHQKKAWMRMVGESIALALSDDHENAEHILSMAEEFVVSRSGEVARSWYLKASIAAFLFAIACGLLLSIPNSQHSLKWCNEYMGTAVLFGAVGAQFSVFLRLSTLNVDPGAGQDAHYIEAVVRILLGVFAGVIAVVAVQSNVIFGFIAPDNADNNWLIPMMALLAGASERFVPGILHNFENSTLKKTIITSGHIENRSAETKAKASAE